MAHILIIEDDPALGEMLTGDLQLEGYKVTVVKDGAAGLDRARALKPDLILLDINLPKMSGYDVCRWLRKGEYRMPIIMLTAKGQEAEKVIGLDLGADDYISKPFGAMELLARIRALLRRHKRDDQLEQVQFDDISVDFKRMLARKNGKALDLTTKEIQVLEYLIKRRGETITRDEFMKQVWSAEAAQSSRTVDNRIMELRRKLSATDPEAYIVSVHGVGYKFVSELKE